MCVSACACACVMYDTDQCRTHLTSLWFVGGGGGRRGGGGFPYSALCGLFWWDCVLRVYRISHLR